MTSTRYVFELAMVSNDLSLQHDTISLWMPSNTYYSQVWVGQCISECYGGDDGPMREFVELKKPFVFSTLFEVLAQSHLEAIRLNMDVSISVLHLEWRREHWPQAIAKSICHVADMGVICNCPVHRPAVKAKAKPKANPENRSSVQSRPADLTNGKIAKRLAREVSLLNCEPEHAGLEEDASDEDVFHAEAADAVEQQEPDEGESPQDNDEEQWMPSSGDPSEAENEEIDEVYEDEWDPEEEVKERLVDPMSLALGDLPDALRYSFKGWLDCAAKVAAAFESISTKFSITPTEKSVSLLEQSQPPCTRWIAWDYIDFPAGKFHGRLVHLDSQGRVVFKPVGANRANILNFSDAISSKNLEFIIKDTRIKHVRASGPLLPDMDKDAIVIMQVWDRVLIGTSAEESYDIRPCHACGSQGRCCPLCGSNVMCCMPADGLDQLADVLARGALEALSYKHLPQKLLVTLGQSDTLCISCKYLLVSS